ncbi:MAG: HAMP domain-containing histidine kinase [Saprospiraceae bacterium]|nr:HAMP domain-containing histidine kinase [Saprospiraceae bacterium]
MDIYSRKSYWKWYLAAGGVLIIIISLIYTKHVTEQLAQRERQQVEQYKEAQRTLAQYNNADTIQIFHCDLTFPLKIVQDNTTVPIILVDDSGKIVDWRNIGEENNWKIDSILAYRRLAEMRASNADSIRVFFPPDINQYIFYTQSTLLDLLLWYPYLQLLLIAAFILFGYLGFSSARRAEQNQVWLGMAKETAHQLGTPITAILGWIETLRAVNDDDATTQEMLDELGNDVSRLELVADRFSKIGSQPELTPTNFYDQLEKNREYMQRRAPRRVVFEFPNPAAQPPLMVGINAPLFDWVIENLLRNAIDAMEHGEGKIMAIVYEEGRYVCLDVADTGKGIPSGKFKTIFKPGYSTKTRGWGLGLSLSKRIIEQYHSGKIFVKTSEVGFGTTFTVKMPKVK